MMPLWSRDLQMSNKQPLVVKIGDAVDQQLVSNSTLA